ncbi:hypothetical protein B0H21DRAFT_719954 [Amylocystis lapponica]|nr:hypothetical protein B0H21DRAFT_719954 [Amylocystis lapponica]
MGSTQSYISSEAAIASLFVAGVVAYGYTQYGTPTADAEAAPTPAALPGKRKKKKQATAPVESQAGPLAGRHHRRPLPAYVLPVKPAKAKKKKGKKTGTPVGAPRTQPMDAMSESSATAPESSVRPAKSKKGAVQKLPADADEHWTRVEARGGLPHRTHRGRRCCGGASDAGITTSDETPGVEDSTARSAVPCREALPSRARLGMLETPDYPTVARVLRVQPGPNDRPAAGFSWGDYEDVDNSRGTTDDADGEDDGGWGVVKGRGRTRTGKAPTQQIPVQAAPETLTKRQRQNAAKREAQKAVKGDAEADRLARLAQHHRELEREKIAALYGKPANTAYVDNKGKLVFD